MESGLLGQDRQAVGVVEVSHWGRGSGAGREETPGISEEEAINLEICDQGEERVRAHFQISRH